MHLTGHSIPPLAGWHQFDTRSESSSHIMPLFMLLALFNALLMLLKNIANVVKDQVLRVPNPISSTYYCDSDSSVKGAFHVPFDSLPTELIVDIFYLATNESPKSRMHMPMVLAHVNRRWRNTAFSTSILWNYIAFTFPSTHAEIELVQVGLQLSLNQPVDLLIDLRDEEWDWVDETHEMQADTMFRIFDLIARDSYRWKSIQLLADNWQPIHAFLALSTKFSTLPMLERLSLARCNEYFGTHGLEFAPSDLREPIELFGGNCILPNLRYVTFSGVHVDWSTCHELKGLLELEFQYLAPDVVPTMDQFLHIVRASPQLQKLSLIGCTPRTEQSASSDSQLFLPSLKVFGFGWSEVQEAVDLLSTFRFLHLEELLLEDVLGSLWIGGGTDPSPVIALVGDFCRSSRLRKLTLGTVNLDLATFHTMLNQMGSLEEIDLRGGDVWLPRVLQEDVSTLCPSLKMLKVRFSERVGSVMNEVLKGVALARETLVIEAMEVKVEFDTPPDSEWNDQDSSDSAHSSA